MLNLGWVVKDEVVEVEEEEKKEEEKKIHIQVEETKDSLSNVKEWLLCKEKVF